MKRVKKGKLNVAFNGQGIIAQVFIIQVEGRVTNTAWKVKGMTPTMKVRFLIKPARFEFKGRLLFELNCLSLFEDKINRACSC